MAHQDQTQDEQGYAGFGNRDVRWTKEQVSWRKGTVDIGSRTEMFVDDWLLGETLGVSLTLTNPERREVAIVFDQPWEQAEGLLEPGLYSTVIQESGRIQLYYRGPYIRPEQSRTTLYAESRDGIHFERPVIGRFEVEGSKRNNAVFQGAEASTFTPFLDKNPKADPDARYKAWGGMHGVDGGPFSGLIAFESPDGIAWRRCSERPDLVKGYFDALNPVFWDRVSGLYRSYTRYYEPYANGHPFPFVTRPNLRNPSFPHRSPEAGGYRSVRAFQNATSADFLHWSEPRPNRYTNDIPLEHFYTDTTQPCPDAEHIFISFPGRFFPPEGAENLSAQGSRNAFNREHSGFSDIGFMTSRNGVDWDRSFMEAWMRPGEPRNWGDHIINSPAWGVVETSPREFSLYVLEHSRTHARGERKPSVTDAHDYPLMRRVVVRKHGFASMRAGYRMGEFTTRPFTFKGSRLRLNYATSAGGFIRVEVQDELGRPQPGYELDASAPLVGDEIDGSVHWKERADLLALGNGPIRLRFVMRDADVYALRVVGSADHGIRERAR